LEGRNPTRARFDGCLHLRATTRRSLSRPESTSGVAATGPSGPVGERQERRGPEKGTAGREEQGPGGGTPWALRRSTDRRQACRGVSRREGSQTLRAEGAGAWNPRVDRTLQAGMCRRGRNPRKAVLLPFGAGEGSEGPDTPEASQACVALLHALACGSAPPGRPQGGRNRGGGVRNRIGTTGGGSRRIAGPRHRSAARRAVTRGRQSHAPGRLWRDAAKSRPHTDSSFS
jgi:hypothetical protein